MPRKSFETSKLLDVEGGAPYSPIPSSTKEETIVVKPRKSCCKIFCYVLLGLFALFLATGLLAAGGTYIWTKCQVRRFTVTDRMELPIHDIPESDLEIAKDKAILFVDTIKAGKIPENDLTITTDEINGLIASSDYLRGNAFVSLAQGKFSADLSLPAKFLPGGKNRYFVASGFAGVSRAEPDEDHVNKALVTTFLDTLRPIEGVDGPFLLGEFLMYWKDTLAGGQHELVVNMKSGKFLNWIAPDDWIAKKENLVEDIYEDDHHHGHHHHDDHHHHGHHHHHDDEDCDPRQILNGIDSISFEDGSLTIHARRPAGGAADSTVVLSENEDGMVTEAATLRARSWKDGPGGARKLVGGLVNKILF